MTKALYGRLFSWIVNKINQLLAPEEQLDPSQASEIGKILKPHCTTYSYLRPLYSQQCVSGTPLIPHDAFFSC